jgi:hypothetical protein
MYLDVADLADLLNFQDETHPMIRQYVLNKEVSKNILK